MRMGDDSDVDVDFDIDLGESDDKEKDIISQSPKKDDKGIDKVAIDYKEEFMAERRRHEQTKEQLFMQEDQIVTLKARIEKLEKSGPKTANSEEKALRERIANLEEELHFSLGAAEDIRALKSKSLDLVERIRVVKQDKARAESDVRSMSKKIDMLSAHIEKLMLHLKHEAAAKLKAMDSLRGSEHRCIELRDRNSILTKKLTVSERCIHELREGSKILEDQLRLMDEKYLELRTKLDYSRAQSAKRVEIAEKKATKLRVKYAMLGNSKLLDREDEPMFESQEIESDPATFTAGSPRSGVNTPKAGTSNSKAGPHGNKDILKRIKKSK